MAKQFILQNMTLPLFMRRLEGYVKRNQDDVEGLLRLADQWHTETQFAVTFDGEPLALLWCIQRDPTETLVYAADHSDDDEETESAFVDLCTWLEKLDEEGRLPTMARAKLKVVRGWPVAQKMGSKQADYCDAEGLEPDTLRLWARQFAAQGFTTGWEKLDRKNR